VADGDIAGEFFDKEFPDESLVSGVAITLPMGALKKTSGFSG